MADAGNATAEQPKEDENQPLKAFVYYGVLLLSLVFLGIAIFLMMSGKKDDDDGCGATCVVSKKGKKKTRTVIISS